MKYNVIIVGSDKAGNIVAAATGIVSAGDILERAK